MGNIVLYDFFYVCVKFHKKLIIKCPFIGILKMWHDFAN
jgi:hypothetical protein